MRFPIMLLVVWSTACGRSSSTKPDAPAGATFACGATTCSTATQYCYDTSAGVAPGSAAFGCNDFAAACAGMQTCDCVMANATFSCALSAVCSTQGAAVTVTCPGI